MGLLPRLLPMVDETFLVAPHPSVSFETREGVLTGLSLGAPVEGHLAARVTVLGSIHE